MKLNITELSSITGVGKVALEDAVKDLEMRSYYTPEFKPEDVKLYYLTDAIYDGAEFAMNFSNPRLFPIFGNTYDNYNEVVCHKDVHGYGNNVFGNDALYYEHNEHRWIISIYGEEYLLGERAMDDIIRMGGLFGKGTALHTPAIAKAAMENLINIENKWLDAKGRPYHPVLKGLVRTDDSGNKKLLSIRTGKYSAIPQTTLLSTIDGMLGVGTPEVGFFEVTNFMTKVNVSFPDIAEDYKKTFYLEEDVTPGVCLVTSDTGDSSYQAIATIKVGSEAPLPVVIDSKTKVSKRHYGACLTDKIVGRVNMEIYGQYKEWPERISRLFQIHTKIDSYEGMKLVFRTMDLRRRDNVIREEVENKLIDEMYAAFGWQYATPYAIAKYCTKATEFETLTENQKEFIKNYLVLAYTTDFSELL